LQILVENNALLKSFEYSHRYPYDWRTKKPVIQIATEQWFVTLEGLKDQALSALKSVQITPPSGNAIDRHNHLNLILGRPRLESTVGSRSEWCISRQRHWGVPIPAFVNPLTQEILMNTETIQKFEEMVREHGTDCWWELDSDALLPEKYHESRVDIKYQKAFDTLDVWFDSGTSWKAVFADSDVNLPVDLVVEGSDQHRGWFQSLLLTSVATSGAAPYKAILSHGFTVDEKLQKVINLFICLLILL
jgi:isoleucyl-tRNA synthetase